MRYRDIVNRICVIMEEKNLSDRKLSGLLDRDDSYFNRIKNGHSALSIEVLLEILDILNVSAEEFFYGNPDSYKVDKELISSLGKMDVEKKKSLLDFLNKNG